MEESQESQISQKKRLTYFPWIEKVNKSFARCFPADYDAETLSMFHWEIEKQMEIMLISSPKKNEALFSTLVYFYNHFCWKIKWNKPSPDMKMSCAKILSYLCKVGIVLSQGDIESKWLTKVLSAFKVFPGDSCYLYDSLLQIVHMKKKFQPSYTMVLRHILSSPQPNPKDPFTFFKLMFLLRRLKLHLQHPWERTTINALAAAVAKPSNIMQWLRSNGLGELCHMKKKKQIGHHLMGKKLGKAVLNKLRKVVIPDLCVEKSVLEEDEAMGPEDKFLIDIGLESEKEQIKETINDPIKDSNLTSKIKLNTTSKRKMKTLDGNQMNSDTDFKNRKQKRKSEIKVSDLVKNKVLKRKSKDLSNSDNESIPSMNESLQSIKTSTEEAGKKDTSLELDNTLDMPNYSDLNRNQNIEVSAEVVCEKSMLKNAKKKRKTLKKNQNEGTNSVGFMENQSESINAQSVKNSKKKRKSTNVMQELMPQDSGNRSEIESFNIQSVNKGNKKRKTINIMEGIEPRAVKSQSHSTESNSVNVKFNKSSKKKRETINSIQDINPLENQSSFDENESLYAQDGGKQINSNPTYNLVSCISKKNKRKSSHANPKADGSGDIEKETVSGKSYLNCPFFIDTMPSYEMPVSKRNSIENEWVITVESKTDSKSPKSHFKKSKIGNPIPFNDFKVTEINSEDNTIDNDDKNETETSNFDKDFSLIENELFEISDHSNSIDSACETESIDSTSDITMSITDEAKVINHSEMKALEKVEDVDTITNDEETEILKETSEGEDSVITVDSSANQVVNCSSEMKASEEKVEDVETVTADEKTEILKETAEVEDTVETIKHSTNLNQVNCSRQMEISEKVNDLEAVTTDEETEVLKETVEGEDKVETVEQTKNVDSAEKTEAFDSKVDSDNSEESEVKVVKPNKDEEEIIQISYETKPEVVEKNIEKVEVIKFEEVKALVTDEEAEIKKFEETNAIDSEDIKILKTVTDSEYMEVTNLKEEIVKVAHAIETVEETYIETKELEETDIAEEANIDCVDAGILSDLEVMETNKGILVDFCENTVRTIGKTEAFESVLKSEDEMKEDAESVEIDKDTTTVTLTTEINDNSEKVTTIKEGTMIKQIITEAEIEENVNIPNGSEVLVNGIYSSDTEHKVIEIGDTKSTETIEETKLVEFEEVNSLERTEDIEIEETKMEKHEESIVEETEDIEIKETKMEDHEESIVEEAKDIEIKETKIVEHEESIVEETEDIEIEETKMKEHKESIVEETEDIEIKDTKMEENEESSVEETEEIEKTKKVEKADTEAEVIKINELKVKDIVEEAKSEEMEGSEANENFAYIDTQEVVEETASVQICKVNQVPEISETKAVEIIEETKAVTDSIEPTEKTDIIETEEVEKVEEIAEDMLKTGKDIKAIDISEKTETNQNIKMDNEVEEMAVIKIEDSEAVENVDTMAEIKLIEEKDLMEVRQNSEVIDTDESTEIEDNNEDTDIIETAKEANIDCTDTKAEALSNLEMIETVADTKMDPCEDAFKRSVKTDAFESVSEPKNSIEKMIEIEPLEIATDNTNKITILNESTVIEESVGEEKIEEKVAISKASEGSINEMCLPDNDLQDKNVETHELSEEDYCKILVKEVTENDFEDSFENETEDPEIALDSKLVTEIPSALSSQNFVVNENLNISQENEIATVESVAEALYKKALKAKKERLSSSASTVLENTAAEILTENTVNYVMEKVMTKIEHADEVSEDHSLKDSKEQIKFALEKSHLQNPCNLPNLQPFGFPNDNSECLSFVDISKEKDCGLNEIANSQADSPAKRNTFYPYRNLLINELLDDNKSESNFSDLVPSEDKLDETVRASEDEDSSSDASGSDDENVELSRSVSESPVCNKANSNEEDSQLLTAKASSDTIADEPCESKSCETSESVSPRSKELISLVRTVQLPVVNLGRRCDETNVSKESSDKILEDEIGEKEIIPTQPTENIGKQNDVKGVAKSQISKSQTANSSDTKIYPLRNRNISTIDKSNVSVETTEGPSRTRLRRKHVSEDPSQGTESDSEKSSAIIRRTSKRLKKDINTNLKDNFKELSLNSPKAKRSNLIATESKVAVSSYSEDTVASSQQKEKRTTRSTATKTKASVEKKEDSCDLFVENKSEFDKETNQKKSSNAGKRATRSTANKITKYFSSKDKSEPLIEEIDTNDHVEDDVDNLPIKKRFTRYASAVGDSNNEAENAGLKSSKDSANTVRRSKRANVDKGNSNSKLGHEVIAEVSDEENADVRSNASEESLKENEGDLSANSTSKENNLRRSKRTLIRPSRLNILKKSKDN